MVDFDQILTVLQKLADSADDVAFLIYDDESRSAAWKEDVAILDEQVQAARQLLKDAGWQPVAWKSELATDEDE